MTVWLIMFLFNVNTQKFNDPATFITTYPNIEACSTASIEMGVQLPDKDGNVKIYDCQVPINKSPM